VRCVVDANVWLSGLAKPTSASGIVISQTINGNLTPVFSRTSWGELAEVLHRPKILRWLSMSGLEATEYLDALEQIAQFVTPLKRVPVAVRDVKDIPLLAAALARPVATALITGDMDLLVLQGQVNTDVISPSDFVGKYLSQ
jgi:putative PIN family toxin of toxin-antitoxin system